MQYGVTVILLITRSNRKLYLSFQLGPKSTVLNDSERTFPEYIAHIARRAVSLRYARFPPIRSRSTVAISPFPLVVSVHRCVPGA